MRKVIGISSLLSSLIVISAFLVSCGSSNTKNLEVTIATQEKRIVGLEQMARSPTAMPMPTQMPPTPTLAQVPPTPTPYVMNTYPERQADGSIALVQQWSDGRFTIRIVQQAPTPTSAPGLIPKASTPTIDLRTLNWIDREFYTTGLLPLIPNWLVPLVVGANVGDRVAKGQEPRHPGIQTWTHLKPSEQCMYLEFVAWQGYNVVDWLDYMSRAYRSFGGSGVDYFYYLALCPYAFP